MKQYVLAVLAAGSWMNVSEFIRNELVLRHYWVDGFKDIGLVFPSEPVNGVVWGLWAFVFVSVLVWLTTRFDILKSTIISWTVGFVLLWIAMWNMGILPDGLLYVAAPWSFGEVYIAALICRKVTGNRSA